MKSIKTVVVVDYNTQKLTDLLETLTESYPVSVVSPQHLPDLPMPFPKVLSVIMLCLKPDEDIKQAIRALKACYSPLNVAILSPKPTMEMITQTLTAGATDYFDLAADEPIRFFHWLNQINLQKQTPSVWSWLHNRLHPRSATAQPIVKDKLQTVEPLLSALSEKFRDKEEKNEPPKSLIQVQFFGEFNVQINGRLVVSKSNGLLFAYLIFHHKRPIHKEALMSKFWGENVNDARNCLNVAICSLRKSLSLLVPEKTPVILFQNDYYTLNTAYWRIETDIDQFIQRWEKTRSLQRTQGLPAAVEELRQLKALYRDEFLPNFNHEWAVGKRDEFREKYLQALNLLCEHYWKTQELNECMAFCQDILGVDDCVETTHRRLMECFIQLKMKDRAVRQYKKCVDCLRKLNIMPERETENLYQSILTA